MSATAELVTFVTTDLAAITRGRSVARTDLDRTMGKGVGWVPANLALTPFGDIASPNPFGSEGDLRLMPDPDAGVRVAGLPGATPLHYHHGDLLALDGQPWEGCLRSMLKAAAAALEAEAGLRVVAAFEHEFCLLDTGRPSGQPFALSKQRAADPFGTLLVAALHEGGCEPEVFLPEYGTDQFEVVCAPAGPLAAADRAVNIREITREVARLCGGRASFSPRISEGGVGNGVHIHLSLTDLAGNPITHDPDQPGGLSQRAGQFFAGIVRHMQALTAFCAPTKISYTRLQPHLWSAAWTTLGERDREATLRICPVSTRPGENPARSYNVEFRAADATASPHLSLALLIRAGLEGLRAGLPPPPIVRGDPDEMGEDQRKALGIHRLPASMAEALAAIEADATVQGWFMPVFLDCYFAMKRKEAELVAGLEGQALCDRYAEIY